jgi:hypothetical protein
MKAESQIDAVESRPLPSPQFESPDKNHFRRHALNIGLIVLALIAMFWRVFFLGETLIDVATLNNQLPWGYAAGASDYPYNRRDLTDMYVTRDYFVVAAYRDGEMPLWNPYTMAGHPIYADGVTRTLSPFLLFYKFFDVPLGYSLARIMELMLAAAFMYIFLIAIGVSANGALIGSLVFELSAHSMLHLTGLGWYGGLMWLPLIFLFIDRAITRRSYTQATLAGVFLAAQFFCGYLPNQIYYAGAIVLCYLFFGAQAWRKLEDRERKTALKRHLGLMAMTLGVGFALAATQWVPMMELLRYSNRKIVGAELSYIYLPPWYALTSVFPNLFGAAYDTRALTLFTALGVSHDHILYIGIAALAPLGFCIYWLKQSRDAATRGKLAAAAASENESGARNDGRRVAVSPRRRVAFFALLAAAALVVMMTTPLYIPVTKFIPVLQVIRVAVRAGVLLIFAVAVLVAFGMDWLIQADRDTLARYARAVRRFLFVIVGFVLVAVAASLLMKGMGLAVESSDKGKMAFVRKTAVVLSAQFLPPDASILIPLVMLTAVAILLWFFSKGRISRQAFFASLVVLLVVDLFWASGQFNRTFERSRVYPATEITDTLRALPPGRVLVVPSDLETNRRVASNTEKIIAPPNTLLPYQISTVSGKNQQFPRWYREYAALIEPQNNLSHVVFDQPRSRYFDLLNVRYVVTHATAPPLDGYKLIKTAEGLSVYENEMAKPRAFFASRTDTVKTHEEALERLGNPKFDTVDAVVIENPNFSDDFIDAVFRGKRVSPPQATIIEDRRNRVTIETENEWAETLVLSDNYYPGWQACVDGVPVDIYRANCTMRAVTVPAGRHVITFVFTPTTLKASVYVSLAATGFVMLTLIVAMVRRKRETTGEE